jgi:hypothetical protein
LRIGIVRFLVIFIAAEYNAFLKDFSAGNTLAPEVFQNRAFAAESGKSTECQKSRF